MSDRLFVNEQEIDLDPKRGVSVVVNGIDIGNVTVQRSNYSNRVKIPITPQNLKKLGFPDEIASSDRSCYKLLPCSLWKDGFQIIAEGILKIEDVNEYIEATAFSADVGFFKLIKGLGLSDLEGLEVANHFWNMDEVEEYAASAVGEILPLYAGINYKFNPASGGEWNYQFMFPAWYLYDLIYQSFINQGYKPGPTGWAFSEPDLFSRMILPFSNKKFENGEAYVAEHTFEASTTGNTTVDFDYENLSGSLENVNEIQIVNLPDEAKGNPNYSNPNFTEPNASICRVYGSFRVSSFSHSYVDVPPADPPLSFHYIALVKNGTEVIFSNQIGTDASLPLATYIIEEEVQLEQNDELSLAFVTSIESLALGDEVHVDAVLDDALFYTQTVQTEIFAEGWVEVRENLPPIKQSDLITFSASLLAAYIVVDPVKKLWTFKKFTDISKRKSRALDWNSKLVSKKGQRNWYISKKTKPDNFYQKNEFVWLDDETVPNTLGDGFFELENEHLDKSGEFINNLFAATEQRVTSGKSLAYIDKYEDDFTELKENDIEPRLCVVDETDLSFSVDLTDAIVGGSSGPTVTLLPVKFSEPGFGGLAWDRDIKARYWTELISSLNNFVEVEVYLELTAPDVAVIIEQYQGVEEDIVPIYLKGFYWLLKQIKSFRSDEFSRVILQKIE